MKTFRNPKDIHEPLAGYSHQVELGFSERLLILSGQVGMRKDGTIPDDPIEQLKVALDNIEINLKTAGMGIRDIVKMTFYVVGQMDADERRSVINSYLGDHQPCMTLLFVAALAAPSFKVEIEAMASRGD